MTRILIFREETIVAYPKISFSHFILETAVREDSLETGRDSNQLYSEYKTRVFTAIAACSVR
jgi:hypothetical protein